MSTWGNVVLSKADVPIRHSYLSTLQIPCLQDIVQRLETAGFCCLQLSVPPVGVMVNIKYYLKKCLTS